MNPEHEKKAHINRYEPLRLLRRNKVPCVVWFEDTLRYYGVPTVLFDLYILVPNIEVAANLLIKEGWVLDTQGPAMIGNAEVDLPQSRLVSVCGQKKTVLLPASDWKFAFPWELQQRASYFPSFPEFLDALVESWLDCPFEDPFLLLHLACQIGYLYAHAGALQERAFAKSLKRQHRQFHYDVLAGMVTGTAQFRAHERAVRDAFLQGQYELQECSAYCDNAQLFPVASDAHS
ncbi:hypothetical protein BDV25DRAFT_170167 [Aspergillus avenaceus]|uniref:Uncharacterized protein n=1 Tax=Aspergillus avenaceus TaxID=36643 RepID=A0A5N6THV0_ASPAV|nr:hypothetical protein BDV25DRAFT_170167 [Aspergillus avenaceus]